MWVFTSLGFFSIVAHRTKPGYVMVRARELTDLQALVKRLPTRPRIQTTWSADYRYRVTVTAASVGKLLEQLTKALDYDNFKNEVARVQGNKRAELYHDVWSIMLSLRN